jgi:hypothetical protein
MLPVCIEPFDLPLHSARPIAKWVSRLQSSVPLVLVFLLSLLFTVILQQRSGCHNAELSGYPDEPAHYITFLMTRSYLYEGHFASPMRFAEDYYLHYPKVAIGHWPPVYYLVQCIWALVFPASISSILYLQAVLLAITSAILFAIAQSRFDSGVAFILSATFLLLYPTQELGSEIMSEPLLALTTFAATLSIARYFETTRAGPLIGFVALVEVAAHVKGSGIALVGAPVLLVICLRRNDLFRNRIFWLAQLTMILVLAPWQILTVKMVSNGTDGPVTLELVLTQLREFGPIIVKILGWPLLILVLYGVYLVIVSRSLRDPLHVSCVATVALTLAFHVVSPSGAEGRRLFMAIPEALLLAPLPLLGLVETRHSRSWTYLALFVMAAISLFSTKTSFRKTAVGYRSVAGWFLANSDRGENAVLIASDIDGEGMLISEIGQRQPKPSLYVVRSSKLFEDCDWQKHDCLPTITQPLAAEQVLDSMPVRYVVLDHFSGIPSASSTEVVRRMIAARPDLWSLRDIQPAIAPGSGNRGEILIYQRSGLNQSDQVHVSVNLRRMIGKVVGN